MDAILERHRELFGDYPKAFSADKAFYESMEKIKELEKTVDTVAIATKGWRTGGSRAGEQPGVQGGAEVPRWS